MNLDLFDLIYHHPINTRSVCMPAGAQQHKHILGFVKAELQNWDILYISYLENYNVLFWWLSLVIKILSAF